MARYRVLRVGVWDTNSGSRILPKDPEWHTYQEWLNQGNVPDSYIAPDPPVETLARAKTRKIAQIKREGLALVRARVPGILDFDTLKLVREIILSIAPAARQLTVDMTWLGSMWTTGESTVTTINACTTVAQVDAITVSWPT